MLRSLGTLLSYRLQRWIPEPFVFAQILTLVVALLALGLTDSDIVQVIGAWYQGFWLLLEFTMQIVLLLATGYAIALSSPVSRLIDRLSLKLTSPTAVYLVVMIVGGLFSLVNWGWLVLTALLARELARRVDGIDYAYLVACVYISAQPWVGGLGSSIPLMLNSEGNFLLDAGVLEAKIPIALTLGSLVNGLYIAVYFLTVPALIWLIRPHSGSTRTMADLAEAAEMQEQSVADEAASFSLSGNSVSDRLNNSVWLQLLIATAALWYLVGHFVDNGVDINFNIMIFLFLSLGLLVHRTPIRYVVAMRRACANLSGIIMQYPFYAGIMGITMFTGLGGLISDWMASNATITSFPFIALLSGALVNFAIPSAGGEWAVIGPAMTETAINLAATLPPEQVELYVARIAMAVAYGETSTNLLQPLFLLVVLPVMCAGVRVQARDVMGFLVIPFIHLFIISALLVMYTPI